MGLNHQIPKKRTTLENVGKQRKNKHFATSKKKGNAKNLTVIGNPSKSLEKPTFSATWKAGARKRSDAPARGAPRNHSAIPWKPLENQWFLQVPADGIRCIPLRPSAPHGKPYGYWKTSEIIGKTSFLGLDNPK